MSFLDDVKDLLHIHGAQLNERMQGVEDQLGKIRDTNDYLARKKDYEIKNLRIDVKSNVALTEILKVPAGNIYELLHWSWNAGAAVLPALFIEDGSQMIDVPVTAAAPQGALNPNELIIPENSTLFAKILNAEVNTTLFLQFHRFLAQPAFVDISTIDS